MHHLRHLPPIVRLGVAISCTVGASGIKSVLSLRCIVSADKVSQLSVNDGVGVEVFPCEWCLIVSGWLVLTRGIRCRRLRVGPRRLVLNQTVL